MESLFKHVKTPLRSWKNEFWCPEPPGRRCLGSEKWFPAAQNRILWLLVKAVFQYLFVEFLVTILETEFLLRLESVRSHAWLVTWIWGVAYRMSLTKLSRCLVSRLFMFRRTLYLEWALVCRKLFGWKQAVEMIMTDMGLA